MAKSKKPRNYRKEYDEYQKNRSGYRSDLNGERRRRGIYGKGGGDVPHVDKDKDGKLEKGEFGRTTSAKKNRGVDRVRDAKSGLKYKKESRKRALSRRLRTKGKA